MLKSTTTKSKKRKLEDKITEPPAKKKPQTSKENHPDSSSCDCEPEWEPFELLAEQQSLNFDVAKSLISLLEAGNTIPFIARYRKNLTNNASPELLREIKESYEEINALKAKVNTVIKTVEKQGKLSGKLRRSFACARSIEELEHLYAPFKPGSKRTLAERAKELGLEAPAMDLLHNICNKVDLTSYVDSGKAELSRVEDVEMGVIHIIAAIISTNTEILTFLRELKNTVNFEIKTKKCPAKKVAAKAEGNAKSDETKFQLYFDFSSSIRFLKPHQILAINRGESLKVLSVKIPIPEFVFNKFSNFCQKKWRMYSTDDVVRKNILNRAVEDSYKRLVEPLIIRQIRSDLKLKAEKASCEVFTTNLKHLLLAPPLKGQPILAIDPGFSNGCKLALVSTTGALLAHNIIYPNTKKGKEVAGDVLKKMLIENGCSLITLGNGTACRPTEEWLTELIQNNFFQPLDVSYTIVNEDGASIYSCSPEAKKEFPKLDPNIISAVSLARRIQDPLAELVKVEPKHLGVGMYQHDLKNKPLELALNDVISECVSFVGVDLNTTSQCLLRRIAGLSEKRATLIIEHREKHGPFTHRKQLKDVKTIGARVFEQCAGFLRVGPNDPNQAKSFYKKPNTTKLDCTYIHPESYEVSQKIIEELGFTLEQIGTDDIIKTVNTSKDSLIKKFTVKFDCSPENVKLILDALGMKLNYDFRVEDSSKVPLFRRGLTNINELVAGVVLTGRVSNVTHFGCFVDIGVGVNGLIHSSKLNGISLQLGNKVEVSVIEVDVSRKRISLKAVKKL